MLASREGRGVSTKVMTRSILIQLGSETTETHCGNCPHLVGTGIERGCAAFGGGFHPAFLSGREDKPDRPYERCADCINAEDDLRRHL